MSKFKVGDRVEVIPDPNGRPFITSKKAYQVGDIFTIVDIFIAADLLHAIGNDGKDYGVELCCLRKIDDDHDEIPSDIRAIFSDNCDETLPEPSSRVRENGAEGGEE